MAQYTDAVRTTLNQNQVTGRGDWLRNATSTVFARYTYNKQDSLAGGLQPLQGTGNNSASTNAVLHWTKVLSASKVNDLGVSYSRPNWAYTRPLGLPDSTKVIGLPNTSSLHGGTNGRSQASTWVIATNYIFNAYSNNIQLKDDFGWVRGRHSLSSALMPSTSDSSTTTLPATRVQFTFSRFLFAGMPAGKYQCDGRAAGRAVLPLADSSSPIFCSALIPVRP